MRLTKMSLWWFFNTVIFKIDLFSVRLLFFLVVQLKLNEPNVWQREGTSCVCMGTWFLSRGWRPRRLYAIVFHKARVWASDMDIFVVVPRGSEVEIAGVWSTRIYIYISQSKFRKTTKIHSCNDQFPFFFSRYLLFSLYPYVHHSLTLAMCALVCPVR